jgi:TubC N-terminal docking domain
LSALAIIKEAAKCGVRVSLNGDSLALKAVTKPPADLLAKLRAHKSEVIAQLRQEACAAHPAEPDVVEIEERAAMAGGVPGPYLYTWARLQYQRPFGASDQEWWQVIDDAGRFLDQWGSRAVEFGWTAGDLFDVPRDGKPGGLVWFLGGEAFRQLDLGAWLRKTAASSTGLKIN